MQVWSRIFRGGPAGRSAGRGDLPESADLVPVPGCGWYRIHTCDAGVPLPAEGFGPAPGERLALVRVSLERYRGENLPEECLRRIEEVLDRFDRNGTDVILRPAYDFEGRGTEREPDLFSQVLDHLRALAPVVRAFEHRILVFQGLLIGSWGEMHSSKFLTEKRLLALEEAFRSGGNGMVWLAVRRPAFLRTLAGGAGPLGRRTLFDDAIGASETDMGTFGNRSRREAAWGEAWTREDELAFLDQVCARAPVGGEAVLSAADFRLTSGQLLETLRRMHLSYLNCEHDPSALEQWRSRTLRTGDEWDGASLYDYVGAHMGYRFCVRRASVRSAGRGEERLLRLEIENTGFGNLFQEARAELSFDDGTGRRHCRTLDWEPREWLSGSRTVCTAPLPARAGELCLRLCRKWDGSEIRFANRDRTLPTGGKDCGEHLSIS